MSVRILQGDCRDVLPTLAANSVHCVVTSPPYYGLRDYGTALWDGGDAACDHLLGRQAERRVASDAPLFDTMIPPVADAEAIYDRQPDLFVAAAAD